MTNKVELTLIAQEESSEVETFTFYILLTNFQQNCINESCGKKQCTKETPNTLNHENDVVNYCSMCSHKLTP